MSNFAKAKRLEIFIIAVIIAAVGIVYAMTERAAAPSATNETLSSQQTNQISYQGMDGRSALDLLKVFHQVQTKDTSYGPMVIAIDGVQPDSSHFWGFYVNGQLADKGADQYITKNGDLVEWKLDSIQ